MRRTLLLHSLIALLLLAQFVPALTTPATAQDGGQWVTHIVQPEENLFRIALRYNLTVDALMVANNLPDPNTIYVGQQLVIPIRAGTNNTAPPANTIATTVLGGSVMHTVGAGDTLTGIARRYGVTLPALLAANNLSGTDTLLVGQVVVIPLDSPADLGLIGADPSSTPIDLGLTTRADTVNGYYQPDLGLMGAGNGSQSASAPTDPTPENAAAPETSPAQTSTAASDLGILDSPPAASVAQAPGTDPSYNQPDLGLITPESAAWQLQGDFISVGGDNVREIYLNGLALGNNPHAFSKIGDCNSEAPYFLVKFDTDTYNLGPYSQLQPVIDQFSGSFGRDSMTVWTGNHVWAVLDPTWANPAYCWAGETPLACEFRLNRPSIVLIRLGTNEVGSPQLFEQNMRLVIEFAIERGTIPILGTKADRLEGSDAMNGIIRALADEYEIPLWDFSRVAERIPARGLLPDGFHLSYFPPNYTQPLALQSGHPVQNLTALMVLEAVWREVMQPSP